MTRELNLDMAGSISEFESLIKRVLPKNIIYKLIRGKGLEFDGYRKVEPDDDASLIDWKASLRSDGLLAKQYVEERDLKIMFLIDVGQDMIFGSQNKLKCEYAAEMAAALAHVISISGDRIGFALFSDKIVKMFFPSSGKKQFDILVHELSEPENYGGSSNLTGALQYVSETLNKLSPFVIIISDFVNVSEKYEKAVKEFSSLFETIAIVVRDPLDKTLPEVNQEIVISDASGNKKILINPAVAREIYEKNAAKQLLFVENLFRDSKIDFIELNTNEPFSINLALFLRNRGGWI